ncbi:CD151 antigen-like [Argiope bruennichi]|uniref:CD151 antigen-like n=1 Tax=Argiope bruennichi TaxID=94029 RepID=UPI002494B2CE|nr:CD151 antigen-like [Argiope bruennichi]
MSGAWCCSQATEPFFYTGELQKYKVPGIILLFDGSMLLALGLVTICASGTMLRLVLISLCQILYVCLVLESVAGAVAIALDTTARDDAFYEALLRDVERNYGREPKITFAIDKMQIAFNCCGVDGPENWPETLWARNVLVEDSAGHLPLSCCGKDVHRCNEANDALRKKVMLSNRPVGYVGAVHCLLLQDV